MITCKFIGELGNNLFQLATLISQSKNHKLEYFIPDYRHYWNAPVYNKLEFSELFEFKFKYSNIKLNEYVHFDYMDHKSESYTHKYNPIINISDNVSLVGYFQSTKYFDDIEFELKNKYFVLNKKRVLNLRNKYGNLSNAVILHVRHGRDRLENCVYGKSFTQINDEYYKKSLSYIKQRYDIDKILLISDDIDWCKSNIIIDDTIYIENQSNIDDFILYSLCKHNILGNSTFSWWASYLNKNINVTRIIPPPNKYFYRNSILSKVDVSDMYDSNFIVMD